MKKLVVIISAGFLFCIFFGLGMFAVVTNTFGINVDTKGLFPTAEIAVLEEPLFSDNGFSKDAYIFNDAGNKNVKIVNKTGADINMHLDVSEDPTIAGAVDYELFSDNFMFKESGDTILEVYSIPDEYDYFFDTNKIVRYSDTPYLWTLVNEEGVPHYVSEDEETPYIYREETITIKDGESYEIKLS